MPWLIAAGLFLVGLVWVHTTLPAPGSPTTMAASLLGLVTVPADVMQYQLIVVSAIASGASPVPAWAARPPMYTEAQIDGDVTNPAFIAALAPFQVWANANSASWTAVPIGYPAQLRTDGVLDYATAIALVNS